MSVNPVDVQQLAVKYTTIKAATEALQKGELSPENFQALLSFKHESEDDAFYKGLQVEQNPASQELTSEQKEAKDKAKAQQEEEVAQMKAQAAAASKENKVAQVKQGGVTTQEGVITSHGDGTAYTFDIKAPSGYRTKETKDDERARLARYYDEKSGEWIERGDRYATNKEVRKALRAKERELKSDAKAAKKREKQLQKELSEARKSQAAADRAYARGRMSDEEYAKIFKKTDELEQERLQASADYADARLERQEAHAAYRSSRRTGLFRKTGVGADKRAYNANVKANNRLVNTEVYYDKTALKCAKDKCETDGMKLKLATDDDQSVIYSLVALGKRYYKSKSSSPQEKAIWGELANLLKDEEGNDIPLEKVSTKKVQDALIDITGGDMRLNYSEQQILSKETGMSMSDVRHAFKTYGFEAPHPIGKRIVNGLKLAAPSLATMGVSFLLSKTKAGAEAHAEATAEDHAVADATQTTVVNGEVTATASTPGYKFDWTDPYTGEEIHKRVAGVTESVTEYYEAIATANAHAEAHAKAFASASAACEVVAKLTPAGLVAAPALAFLAGFCKTPAEIGAAVQGANNDKLSKFVDMYKGKKNQNIGNQIVQMAGQITGDKAVDRALIVAVLDHDIGSQNTTATTRELRSALAHLDAIKAEVDKFKKLPPAPPTPPPPAPPAPPTPPAPKKEYHADGNNTYTVEKNDILGNIVRAKYPGVDPRKAMQAIKEANGLRDINSLRTGQVLELPEVDGVKPGDAKVKKHIGGKRIKYRPTRTNAQERGSVYEGKAHEGSHDGETVVDSYTGTGARERARKRAEELNNQQ